MCAHPGGAVSLYMHSMGCDRQLRELDWAWSASKVAIPIPLSRFDSIFTVLKEHTCI
jgi:hypothetical protein